MAYLEKDFQKDWGKWWKNRCKKTGVFELKISNGNSLPFSDVKEHQENSMYVSKNGEFYFKPIDNTGYQNPADSICISKGEGMVVIMFYAKERNRKEFVMIDIMDWFNEKKVSDRKSITQERAKEIGEVFFL